MKRLTTVLFVIASLILLAPIPARADMKGKCGKNLQWVLDDDGKLTITGSGRMDDFSKSSQPWRASLVRRVEFPEGLTYIGNNALNGAKIGTANLPSTVTGIGKSAFANCKKMTTAVLPYGLTSIGESAFSNCEALVKVQIPSSVKTIGSRAFADCKLIASIGIPFNVEAIGKDVFDGCNSLTKLTSLPDYITTANCKTYGIAYSVVSNYDRTGNSGSTMATGEVANNFSNKAKEKKTVEAGVKYGESDIDKKMPVRPVTSTRTFAFIFANENYDIMPDVPFATNDGKSFAAYCHSTLGLPENNINVYYNATLGNMRAAVKYMKQIDEAFKGDISFIIYYAGHGAPDEKTSEPYLVPTDAYAIDATACYPLDALYKELGELNAKSVKVFMDACFSGVDRGNDMIAQGGRLVATVPKKAGVTGNVLVISATSNDQAAWHYPEQGHGLFTYCLIKKLQETQGDVSMGELNDYLLEQVPQISIVHNHVTQTPTSQSSSKLGNSWRLWQMKQ